MSGTGEDSVRRAEDVVEALLEQASPRPVPPTEDEQRVREAVRAEWQAVTGKRTARRRIRNFALAATVLLAITVAFNALHTNDLAPVQVAEISKSHGSIYLLGEQSELRELPGLATISAGQTIVTGNASGIGLNWGKGGSLRVAANTRIEFLSAEAVYLRSGRIYFDSQPTESIAAISGGSRLVIDTEYGTVKHLGTQYMTYADEEKLSVSVREGEVTIDGVYYTETAVKGQQLTVSGSGRPSIVNIEGYGEAWEWIEAMSPARQLDGQTVHEFLRWVSRETGLQLQFEGDVAEQLANSEMLKGTVDTEPTNALRIWMMGVDLDWRVEGGVIYVSAIDSGSGR